MGVVTFLGFNTCLFKTYFLESPMQNAYLSSGIGKTELQHKSSLLLLFHKGLFRLSKTMFFARYSPYLKIAGVPYENCVFFEKCSFP